MERKWWVLLSTGLPGLFVAVDYTIVYASLTSIGQELQATVGELQWLVTGFGITFCALMVVMGRLGDIRGHKKVLFFCITGFGLFSLGAGLATSPHSLIVMRVAQGFFGSGLIPCGMALTAAAFPKHEQGRAIGFYSSILGIGLAFGPVLGSLINAFLSWRWIFFINLPVVLISFSVGCLILQETKTNITITIDWIGALLLILFLGSLTFTINEASNLSWANPLILTCACLSLVSLFLFITVEKKVLNPIIPLQLLVNTGMLLALTLFTSSVSLSWSVLFLVPLYLHQVAGYSTQNSGLLLAVMTSMTAIAPAIAGTLFDKVSKTLTIHGMYVIGLCGLLLFITLSTQPPLWLLLPALILYGCAWGTGNGIATPACLAAMQSQSDIGLISGTLTTAMNIIAVIILAITTSLFETKQHQALLAGSGKKLAFLAGMKLVFGLLIICTLIFWLITTLMLKRKPFPV